MKISATKVTETPETVVTPENDVNRQDATSAASAARCSNPDRGPLIVRCDFRDDKRSCRSSPGANFGAIGSVNRRRLFLG